MPIPGPLIPMVVLTRNSEYRLLKILNITFSTYEVYPWSSLAWPFHMSMLMSIIGCIYQKYRLETIHVSYYTNICHDVLPSDLKALKLTIKPFFHFVHYFAFCILRRKNLATLGAKSISKQWRYHTISLSLYFIWMEMIRWKTRYNHAKFMGNLSSVSLHNTLLMTNQLWSS